MVNSSGAIHVIEMGFGLGVVIRLHCVIGANYVFIFFFNIKLI